MLLYQPAEQSIRHMIHERSQVALGSSWIQRKVSELVQPARWGIRSRQLILHLVCMCSTRASKLSGWNISFPESLC